MNNIATINPIPAPASESTALTHMIERAARDPSVDIDKLERLIALQERALAQRAKTAYHAALSEMQPELPVIAERGKIDIGRGKPQSYALWEDINEAIRPVLFKHGFALSFRIDRDAEKILVTGVLSHREGHSEQTTIPLPIDTSGSKNAVQAVGSSTSYGKRYTAGALLNLTSRGEDDDGKAAGGARLTEDQILDLRQAIVGAGADIKRFCAVYGISNVNDLPASKLAEAKAKLATFKRQREGK